MSFYRLCMSLALIVLLILVGTAWAGAGVTGSMSTDLLAERECSLMHVCRGGKNRGQPCTANLEQATNGPETCEIPDEKSQCPDGGKCVVKYVTDINPAIIPGTLTIIADDQPVIRQGDCAARTILLRVRTDDQPHGRATTPDDSDLNEQFDDKADDQPHLLANTALVENLFSSGRTQLEIRLRNAGEMVSDNFRFRQADSDFRNELIRLLKLKVPDETVPIIARVGKLIIKDPHVDDPLGSVLSFRVGIRFAFPKKDVTFTPQQDDMPCP